MKKSAPDEKQKILIQRFEKENLYQKNIGKLFSSEALLCKIQGGVQKYSGIFEGVCGICDEM